jgi:hypothetical protein
MLSAIDLETYARPDCGHRARLAQASRQQK